MAVLLVLNPAHLHLDLEQKQGYIEDQNMYNLPCKGWCSSYAWDIFTFNPILVVAVILGGIDPLAAELNRVGAGPVIDHLLLHVAVGCLHVSALVIILSGTTLTITAGSLELSQLEPYSWLAWTQPCQWPAISLALS